jgi:hypothetical protein
VAWSARRVCFGTVGAAAAFRVIVGAADIDPDRGCARTLSPGSSSHVGRNIRTAGTLVVLLAVAAGCGVKSEGKPGSGSSPAGATGGTSGSGGSAAMASTAGSMASTAGASAGSASDAGAGGAAAAGPEPAGAMAPPAEGGLDGGEPATGCSGVFCESFDEPRGAALDDARWEVVAPNCSGDGEVALDAETAHSGGRSLRVRASGGYCNHVFARPRPSALQLPTPLYGRFVLRLEAALPNDHVTFLAMHDAVEAKDLRMGGQSEILMWNRESDDATLPELSPTGIAASVRPPAQRWMCIEFVIDAAARRLGTWMDGEPVAALQLEGEPTPDIDAQWQRKPDWQPHLEDVKLGFESYGESGNTLWFDDIAFGTSRLGCEP